MSQIQPKSTKSPRKDHVRRKIRTLDSRHITHDDHLNLSMTSKPNVTFGTSTNSISSFLCDGTTYKSFPTKTSGFLYYRPHDFSDFGGQVRFRLTSTTNPTTFEFGTDLLLPNGMPWTISLFRIACIGRWSSIKDLLLADHLTSQDLTTKCQSIIAESKLINLRIAKMQLLAARGDHFAAKFDQQWITIAILSDASLETITLQRILFGTQS